MCASISGSLFILKVSLKMFSFCLFNNYFIRLLDYSEGKLRVFDKNMQPVVGRDRNLFEILSLTHNPNNFEKQETTMARNRRLNPITHHVINTMDRGTGRREQKQRKKRACQYRPLHPPRRYVVLTPIPYTLLSLAICQHL